MSVHLGWDSGFRILAFQLRRLSVQAESPPGSGHPNVFPLNCLTWYQWSPRRVMAVLVGGISFALSSGAFAQDPPPPAEARLDNAIEAYMAGDHAQARDLLTDILVDETVMDEDLLQRARVLLGEVLYVEGRTEAAWDTFRAILDEQPDYELDPYEHPPDVIRFFETVRGATAVRTRPPDPNPDSEGMDGETRRSFPLLTLAPFGLYQITHEQPVKGTLLALGQAAAGAGSVLLYVQLNRDHVATTDEEYQSLVLRRNAQWALFGGFYGLWLVGASDGIGHWRARPSVSVLPPDPQATGAGSPLWCATIQGHF